MVKPQPIDRSALGPGSLQANLLGDGQVPDPWWSTAAKPRAEVLAVESVGLTHGNFLAMGPSGQDPMAKRVFQASLRKHWQ